MAEGETYPREFESTEEKIEHVGQPAHERRNLKRKRHTIMTVTLRFEGLYFFKETTILRENRVRPRLVSRRKGRKRTPTPKEGGTVTAPGKKR